MDSSDILSNKIVSNKKLTSQIYSWLKNYNKNRRKIVGIDNNNTNKRKKRKKIGKKTIFDQSFLIIKGDHGAGKTYAINTIVDICGYKKRRVDFKNHKKQNMDNLIKYMNDCNNILKKMNVEKYEKKTVIVIDNIESIISPTENKNITEFLKQNEINWYYPTILISTKNHNKVISKIKEKDFIHLEFKSPSFSEMFTIVTTISEEHKLSIDTKSKKLIINHCQNDLRRLVNIVGDLKRTFGSKSVDNDEIAKYLDIFDKKDRDICLYDAADILINSYNGIDENLKYYEVDKVMIPIMMHQYYIQRVIRDIPDIDSRYDVTDTITKSLSDGDIIENYIYGDQNWNLSDLHGFNTCIVPSFHLNSNAKKYTDINYKFVDDLTKTSIKMINAKNIRNINRRIKNKNIHDYIYMTQIFRALIDNNNLEECADLLKNNNMEIADLESLLKIDKIKNSKTKPLTSKQKKEINKFLSQ